MSRRPKLLIVDDLDRYVELAHAFMRDYDYATRCDLPGPCWTCAKREGCPLTHAHNAKETEEALRLNPDVDAVLLDVAFQLPEAELLRSGDQSLEVARRRQGLLILEKLRSLRGDLPVILMTSRDELALEESDEALLADEFVTVAGSDAFDARALSLLIERSLKRDGELGKKGEYLFGKTKAMAALRNDAVALAQTSLPILVVGEPGTGKSALSEHVIHPASGRSGPHVAVDLSAIPPQLVAAELFGTARGAFSGAVERDGLFQRAEGGTLLLDEIGNLEPGLQRLLLLVLQNREVTRLGESAPRAVDVKLVAATNSDLEASVRRGDFRADLYARLNPAARLHVSPLRHRLEDLPELLQTFTVRTFAKGGDRALLHAYQKASGIEGPPKAQLVIGPAPESQPTGVTFVMSKHLLSLLRKHAWPGNVRELSLLVSTALLLALAGAKRASDDGRGAEGTPWVIPLSARLVRQLLASSWHGSTETGSHEEDSFQFLPQLQRHPDLRSSAKALEAQHYVYWFKRTGGDFHKMAAHMLQGDSAHHARKVRLRFNQLGLSARKLKVKTL